MTQDYVFYKTPIGTVKIEGDQHGITAIIFMENDIESSVNIPDALKKCVVQLEEYFRKERTSFDLKLKPYGTEFQQKVWNELGKIPFGNTITYMDQSKKMKNIKAIRAIAAANGKNPISIIVPCHRVLGSDGSLTGYAGGIWRKKWLLEHEIPSRQTSLF